MTFKWYRKPWQLLKTEIIIEIEFVNLHCLILWNWDYFIFHFYLLFVVPVFFFQSLHAEINFTRSHSLASNDLLILLTNPLADLIDTSCKIAFKISCENVSFQRCLILKCGYELENGTKISSVVGRVDLHKSLYLSCVIISFTAIFFIYSFSFYVNRYQYLLCIDYCELYCY